jgi:hypothetical protein
MDQYTLAITKKKVKNSFRFLEKCKAHLHEHYTFQKTYKPITLCKASYNYTKKIWHKFLQGCIV